MYFEPTRPTLSNPCPSNPSSVLRLHNSRIHANFESIHLLRIHRNFESIYFLRIHQNFESITFHESIKTSNPLLSTNPSKLRIHHFPRIHQNFESIISYESIRTSYPFPSSSFIIRIHYLRVRVHHSNPLSSSPCPSFESTIFESMSIIRIHVHCTEVIPFEPI
jgi:hypothetical protein